MYEVPLLQELELEMEEVEPYISGDDEWEDVNDFEQVDDKEDMD
jgi:hypothetical protein